MGLNYAGFAASAGDRFGVRKGGNRGARPTGVCYRSLFVNSLNETVAAILKL